jgi:uncharacterized protein YukE
MSSPVSFIAISWSPPSLFFAGRRAPGCPVVGGCGRPVVRVGGRGYNSVLSMTEPSPSFGEVPPMSRPAGEPGALAAGARSLAAGAAALRELGGRLQGAMSLAADADAWRGPASQAFLADGVELRTRLGRAAATLDEAAGALAELSARLEHAQGTWDRAQRLAATVGVHLDPRGDGSASPFRRLEDPNGGVVSPADAVDPATSLVAGQALRLAQAAEQEAAAARRGAAARLDHAAASGATRSRRRPGGEGDGGDGHGGPVERMVGRVLELGAEVARATHHLVTAAEARAQTAGRLAAAADDPAVRAAAGRVAEAAGRPLIDGRILGALPLAAPILDLTAAMRHGEPLPRALAGAVGSAVGADLGARAGLAACGGEAAATQGAGLIICPTLTAVGGTLGAQAGRAATLHVYDELTDRPGDEPGPSAVRPEPRRGG